jgi:hypothetical protein
VARTASRCQPIDKRLTRPGHDLVGTRNYNHRLVKIHRTYAVDEMADLFGIHRNTVRQWLLQGLVTIDRRRPLLVSGSVLVTFLKERRAKNKRPCAPGEIYCLPCHTPKVPAGGRVTYLAMTHDRGNLVGTCPDCGARLYRRCSLAKLGESTGSLQVTLPQALEHINESSHPSVNCDFNQEALNHA